MGTKVCRKCGEEKSVKEFHKDSSAKDGRKSQCKPCAKNTSREYYLANKESLLEQQREYRQTNKDQMRKYQREYYQTNKARKSEYQREYRQANRDFYCEYRREYYNSNKDVILEKQREYRQANKEKIAEYKLKYQKERMASDPLYTLVRRCRNRTYLALNGQGFSKKSTTKDILGCTYEELMTHLESQFVEGMTWENRSEWHIDHIVPLASAETEEEILTRCHYTNLQPLWAEENLKKAARHV